MLRKCTILGLVLLVLGGLALAWLRNDVQRRQQAASDRPASDSLGSEAYLASYGRWYELTAEEQNQLVLELDKDRHNKTPDELLAEQQSRLRADLDRLASGDLNPGGLAEYLYGTDWQTEVARHRKRKEQQQITQTTSIVCLSIGGTLFGGCSLIGLLGTLVQALKTRRMRRGRRDAEETEESGELTHIHHEDPEETAEEAEPEPLPKQRKKLSEETPWLAETASGAPTDGPNDPQEPEAIEPRLPNRRRSLAMEISADASTTAVLLSDEPLQETEWSPEMEWTSPACNDNSVTDALAGAQAQVEHTAELLESPQTVEPEDPVGEQAENLQEQIAEFKEMAQSVQQATREQSAPLNNTLQELTQQVSAIREYAASQQDRVEKLQEGYDWNIIRTFCLRVIRCLDNIEYRITRLGDSDDAATHLEEVKDELLFALESSGIEQYSPEPHSEYRGQEKLAEAIKEKETCQGPDEAGTIAKVVRPGYRYMIDEDRAKIVRTAQVKLYG